jgi:hypothetical protein
VTTALASVDVDKLGKLLRLALIADQDGEITGAIHALKRSLASCGLDPHYIADCFERGASPVSVPLAAEHDEDDTSLVWFVWHRRERLSPKEPSFIETLTRWRGKISERQRKWLHGMSALAKPKAATVDVVEVFRARAEARAMLYGAGEFSLIEAIDPLQHYAEESRLVELLTQDGVQTILADAFAPFREAQS